MPAANILNSKNSYITSYADTCFDNNIYCLFHHLPMDGMLREKIAGEITVSNDPGGTIKKWRTLFEISQKDLAGHLEISTSVISDYEAGRRKSPGVGTVKKIIDGLLSIDESRGGIISRQFKAETGIEAIIGMGEFPQSMDVEEFCKLIEGEIMNPDVGLQRRMNGFTVIDSLKAITTLDSEDYMKVYGWSTERALLFTGVKHGRSPMIAVRAHPMKPAMVVYVRPENVDDLAIRLATLEKIILVVTDLSGNELLERFKEVGE